MQTLVLDSVSERPGDGFLTGYFVKCLGAPLSGDNLISH